MSSARPISQDLSLKIAELIGSYLASREDDALHRAARAVHAFPVYRDMGGVLFLDAAGRVFLLEHDAKGPPRPETDPHWISVAIASARQKYPELSSLAEPRPPSAAPCAACSGSGWLGEHIRGDRTICGDCGGRGWS